jgi:hypothetical protein
MSLSKSIFKKIFSKEAMEKYDPKYSGQFPIKSDELDQDWVEDLKEAHKNLVAEEYVLGKYKKHDDSASFILHGNGQLDALPCHHYPYLRSAMDSIMPDYNYNEPSNSPDNSKYDRYQQQANQMDTYKYIHHLFQGGIRVFVDENIMAITAYQIPNKEQINMLREIYNTHNINEIKIDLELNRKEFYSGYKTFWDFGTFYNYLQSLKPGSSEISPEARERIEQMRYFRRQWEEKPAQITPPKKPTKPTKPRTQEEIDHFNDPNRKWPSLNKFLMPEAANIMTIIKTAEYFDANNRFEESDLMLKLINNYLAKSITPPFMGGVIDH